MLRDADLVFCVARTLLVQAQEQRPDAVYAPNGVDYVRFSSPSPSIELDRAFLELLESGRPIAGYYGAIDSWLDIELVVKTARLRPDWAFVIIGHELPDAPPLDDFKLLPNALLLGPQPYEALPGYLARFTAALIPFQVNRITIATSPIKLYEYFAGGKPVITTPIPECQAFPEALIAADARELASALDLAMHRAALPDFRERLHQIASQNSWSVRVEFMLSRLAELVHTRSTRSSSAEFKQRTSQSKGPLARRGVGVGSVSKPALAEPTGLLARRFEGLPFLQGFCNVCGTKRSSFFYNDEALYRESLTCGECLTTSRYRSIARGILRAIHELTSVRARSLAELKRKPRSGAIKVYDTQTPFYFERNAYPIPDILSDCDWIDVHTSDYQPDRPPGAILGPHTTNQNLEQLTFENDSFDIVITSDVMELVRLDDEAHREIRRVLRPGGIYLFTVPHFRDQHKSLIRVEIVDRSDPSKDRFLLPKECHGDANSKDGRALCYRVYGTELDARLEELGFIVEYSKRDFPENAIMNTELFYCRCYK